MTKPLTTPAEALGTSTEVDPCAECPPIIDTAAEDAVFSQPRATARHLYLFETLQFLREYRDFPLFPISDYRTELMLNGFTRVFVTTAMTGAPSQYGLLWRLEEERQPLADLIKFLDSSPACQRFRGTLKNYRRELLYPTAYDSYASSLDPIIRHHNRAVSTPETAVLVDRVQLHSGALHRFVCGKEKHFIPTVTGRPHGWTLIASGSVITSADQEILNFWAMANPNRLMSTMRALGQDTAYLTCVEPCIVSEQQQLFELRLGV